MLLKEDQLLNHMNNLLNPVYESTKYEDLIAWVNNVINLLRYILPPTDPQIEKVEKALEEYTSGELFYEPRQIKLASITKGVIKSVYSDYKAGFLKNIRIEIHVEVETDFLDQAQRLLSESQKDPAAMIIGAVLEDTLRQLCKKHRVPEGSNIESMNIPLKQADAYNLATQKQVTAWADIRNNADHARFDQYGIKEVKLMHQGITDFIAKYLT